MKTIDLPILTDTAAAAALDEACEQVRINLPLYIDRCQNHSSVDNIYPACDNNQWTCGFWPGEVWLAFERTGDEAFKASALKLVNSFAYRIDHKIEVDHHDMGFLYCPSCVAAWKLTGNETGKEAALMAADNLLSRFQEKGQFIQAWGELGAKDNYRLIIDCLLNMPILFWATEVTGDQKYARKAQAHIKTAMQNIVRSDNSTYHTFFFDPATGAPVKGVTHQGYRDGSAWARGQAWGVYGSALAYKFLRDDAYADIFCRVTDYFLDHLPKDKIPYWDFDFTDGSDEPRDSSAAAIAACGMLEMSKYLPAEKAQYYTQKAEELVEALIRECAVTDPAVSNGLLLHGTYAKSSPYNTCPNIGVDECVIWGDYFYMEALTRLLRDWEPYWY